MIDLDRGEVLDTDGKGGVEHRRVAYPVEETVAAARAVTADPQALQMLTDIYRGGLYTAKWAANGAARNGNGKHG